MIRKKPVNVKRQMIFAVIPILDLYASYKIQKLKWWVLIFWIVGGVIGWFYYETISSGGFLAEYLNSNVDLISTIDHSIFVIIYAIIQAMVMRRWSQIWNSSIWY